MSDLAERIATLPPEKRELLLQKMQKKLISQRLRLEQAVNTQQQIPPQRRNTDTFALSFAQERLWFLHQLDPQSAAYNVPSAFSMCGTLSIALLEWSLAMAIQRHEVLRTVFQVHEGSPVQVIKSSLSLLLPVIDLSDRSQNEQEDLVHQLSHQEAQYAFDLTTGPLIRARLLRLDEHEHVLLFNMHHIISDGWSTHLLAQEFSLFYQAEISGESATLPALSIQYVDYALWQREWLQGEILQKQLAYWRQKLIGAPVVLNLPTDRPRPAVQTFAGATYTLELPLKLLQELKQLSQRKGATLFMTGLAAFQILLMRYSGMPDIVVGTPIANRTREELEGLIGFFANTLVLRTDLSGNPSFLQLLARVREVALQAYAHQDIPFEKLVEELQLERDLSHQALFQVLFSTETIGASPTRYELPGLDLRPIDVASQTSKFDLILKLSEKEAGWQTVVKYNTDLFNEATIIRLLSHWQVLLEAIVHDPEQAIEMLPLLTQQEHEFLAQGIGSAQGTIPTVQWNATQTSIGSDVCVHQLFEQQVSRTPDAVALVFEEQHLTYAGLNRRANHLAHHLQALGVGPEGLVGIYLERSIEMIIGILGVLKTGGAYVPLDPTHPPQRLTTMLREVQPPVVLTQTHLTHNLSVPHIQLLCLDEVIWQDITCVPDASERLVSNPVSPTTANNLMYIIYTSGSTGKPKGTMVTHANVTRLFAHTNDWFHFQTQDIWTFFHSYAFDFSVWEMWGSLLHGSRLVIVPYWLSRSPNEFYHLLVAEQVTILNQTPSAFRQLIQADRTEAGEMALRLVIFGGEALDLGSLRPWFASHGDQHPQLINMYGITETTVHVTYRPLAQTTVSSPHPLGSLIGLPMADLQCYVLDAHQQLLPLGVPGELYIGGMGLTRGYLHQPETTAERFIPHPWSSEPGARLYRTGDVVRYQATSASLQRLSERLNGRRGRSDSGLPLSVPSEGGSRLPSTAIEYLGRIDSQVKLRGYRIELGDIEATLRAYPGVQECVVVLREEEQDRNLARRQAPLQPLSQDKYLAAYVVAHTGVPAGQRLATEKLRDYLRAQLPDYMIPRSVVELPSLPLTPNGKVDRVAISRGQAPMMSSSEATQSNKTETFIAPRSVLEERLACIWQEILHVQKVGRDDSFFALGGHSITAAIFINTLQELLGTHLHVVTIFDSPTVSELADYLSRHHLDAIERLFGAGAHPRPEADDRARQPLQSAQVAQLRSLIPSLPPLSSERTHPTKNPPAIFLLSPPRSGSTLLRVMLAGHPQLFAPPELELLSFNTLRERAGTYRGRNSFWLEGTMRALMDIHAWDTETAKAFMADCEQRDLTTQDFYALLQQELGERILVDKTPAYALDMAILQRAEATFERARYIHLIRHPSAMIHSFEEAKLDQIFFRYPHPFETRELAELIWLISHQNIEQFLQTIPLDRQHQIRFEDLVQKPAQVMEELAAFLQIEFHASLLEPYTGQRMTDGVTPVSKMLGDIKFHQHKAIDATAAWHWERTHREDLWGETTWQVAEALGYRRERARGSVDSTLPRIEHLRQDGQQEFVLSFAQERLWFLHQWSQTSSWYNIPIALRLSGQLHMEALEHSLATVVQRHEVLRTTFEERLGRPVQVIASEFPVQVPVIDLRGLTFTSHDEQMSQLQRSEAGRSFDLANGPLLRVYVLRLVACSREAVGTGLAPVRVPTPPVPQEHVLLLTLHHIICDGWSMGVLVREMTTLYQAHINGELGSAQGPHPLPTFRGRSLEEDAPRRGAGKQAPSSSCQEPWAGTSPRPYDNQISTLESPLPIPPRPLRELPIQYVDYALWQREFLPGEVLDAQMAYWREQLADLSPLQLPTDHLRPAIKTDRGASQSRLLPPALSEALLPLCQKFDVTLFMFLLATFQVLLMRYTGQTDISVGTPIANRTRAELEGMIGFFVNTLVLRTDLGGDPTFEQLLRRVREVCLQAYVHQDIPFEKVVEVLAQGTGSTERDMSRTPLFQVMFILQNAATAPIQDLSGMGITPLTVENTTSKFDLTLTLSETEQGLACGLEYSTDLFEAASSTRMLSHFQTLLEGIVQNPQACLSDLPLLTEAEREQVLAQGTGPTVQWNATQVDPTPDLCVHQLIEQQVERTPDTIALVFEDETLTYAQLNSQANHLAHRLQGLGVGPNGLVGVCMERSLELPVALLAILKAGGAYVTLDPSYPQERLFSQLEDAQVSIVLIQTHWDKAPAGESLKQRASQTLFICVGTQTQQCDEWGLDTNPVTRLTPENLAYIISTSGSTGRPKGVGVSHRSLMNLLNWFINDFHLTAQDKTLIVTSFSFDLTQKDLFAPLLVGGTVHLQPDGFALLPIRQSIAEREITLLNCTPSMFYPLVDQSQDDAPEFPLVLRSVFLGGEPIALPRLRPWINSLQMVNTYGPTECTDVVAFQRIELPAQWEEVGVPIGRPISNTQLLVLDENLELVPPLVIGELYVAGTSVGAGYIHDSALTALRFVPNPFAGKGPLPFLPGERLYKTGDLVRSRADGAIEYLGRIDHQVKLRGFRIELGEIEALLTDHPAVQDSVVIAREDEPGKKRLVAYVIAASPSSVEPVPLPSMLRDYLKEKLPKYMVPAAVVLLESLPLTKNGKVDKSALPIPELLHSERQKTFVAPRTSVEKVLAGIWEDVLGLEQVGIHDDFFEVGGHSLLATQVVAQIQETLQVALPLREIFDAPTVAEIAVLLLHDPDQSVRLEKTARVVLELSILSDSEAEAIMRENPLELGSSL